jgi:hypothetical protein
MDQEIGSDPWESLMNQFVLPIYHANWQVTNPMKWIFEKAKRILPFFGRLPTARPKKSGVELKTLAKSDTILWG